MRKTVKRAPYDGYPASPMTLGDKVKKRRMDLGLTQKQAAKQVGVSKMTLINIEHGRLGPNQKQREKIDVFLNQIVTHKAEA